MRYKKEDGTPDYDKIVRELESFHKSSKRREERSMKKNLTKDVLFGLA